MILLVENEPSVRGFLQTALRRAGHHVISTGSGPEAVSEAARSTVPIDLVITDVVMTGIPGPRVAELVSKSHPRAAVLFLSDYSSAAAVPDSPTADPLAFLQKPFSVEALLAKVQERLAHS